MRFMSTKANCFVRAFDRPIPRAVPGTARFLPMLIVAGLLCQFVGAQRIQAAPVPIQIWPPALGGLTVAPASVTLTQSQSQTFSATMTDTGYTAVTWSLSPPVGSISPWGLYTAPASIWGSQTVTVIATSVANPTESASATVTLNPVAPLTVAPASVILTQSQTQTFSATATNTGYTAVTWSISPPVGSISAWGLYTAPGSISGSQTVTVIATSMADPTKSANATVALNPPVNSPVNVTVAPASVVLTQSQTQTFSATVTKTGYTAVTWSLSPPVGSISPWGLYAAPASISGSQTVTVTATSMADPTKSASATVTLNASVGVTVTPASVTLTQSQTQTFSATVTNTGNTAVTWSINPVVGSISAAGLYTAAASINSAQTVTVTATSAADPTKSATATVTLNPSVGVTVTPASVTLTQSQTQTFSAAVTNTGNTAVTWSINPSVGTISSAGLYTAPASINSAQTVTVTATSVADPTRSASAIVTLNPPVHVTVTPASVTLTQSQTPTFSATVTNTGNTAVTWSITPSVGTITSAGLYTSPASITSSQTVAVTATSVADPTNSGSATVTLSPPVTVSVTPTAATMLPSQGQTFTATVTGATSTGVTWSIAPATGTISSAGLYTSPSTIASTSSVAVKATSVADQTKSATALVTLIPPLQITTASLPGGTAGTAYTASLAATGGVAPYTWSVGSGLPPGLSLSAAGTISGTPTTAGSYNVTVKVTDAAVYQATAVVAIVIAAAGCQNCGGLGVTTASVPAGIVGSAYSATLAASGGTPPYTWSISAGQLPPGLTLNSATGVISGAPSSAGSYSFTATVTDSASSHNTASRAYTLTTAVTTLVSDNFNRANGPLGANWTPAFGAMVIVSDAYAGNAAGQDSASYWNASTFTADQYSQAVLTLNDNISQAGVLVRGSLNNGYYCIASANQYIQIIKLVSSSRIVIASTNTYIWHSGDVMRLDAYGSTLRCLINGAAKLTATDSAISTGQPGIAAEDNTRSATGTNWSADNWTGLPLTISPTSFPNALVNTPYSQTLTASNGIPPYRWSITAGSLPAGITLKTSTVAFTGTPTVLGTASFTLRVQDSTSPAAKTNTFPLTIPVTAIDQYGGNSLIHCSAGAAPRFYTAQIGSRWWLCNPLGNAMWGQGVYAVGPQGSLAKYGGSGAAAGTATVNRLNAWGFNFVDAYSTDAVQPWNAFNPIPTIEIVRPCGYGMYASGESAVVGSLGQNIKDLAHLGSPYYTNLNPNGMCDWGDLTRIGQALNYTLTKTTTGGIATAIQGLPATAASLGYVIGIAVEDSDQTWAYFGSVENDPFDTQPSGMGAAYGGFITAVISPYEQADANANRQALFNTDQVVYTKKAWHDFLVAKYGTIGALNTAWGSTYTTFGTTASAVTGEAFGTTNGSSASFTHTLATPGTVSPNTIQIYVDGTEVAGDCFHPNFYDACNPGVAWPAPDLIWGGIYGPTMGLGTVNYSTKAVTVVFNSVPTSGHVITVTYQVNGWDAGGTGLMDEDGRPAHTWIGTDPFLMSNANENTAADMHAGMKSLDYNYFAATKSGVTAAFVNAGVAAPMYVGPDTLGTWTSTPPAEVLQAASTTVDIASFGGAEGYTLTQSMLNFIALNYGRPILGGTFMEANPDSPFSANHMSAAYATQALRGAAYISVVQSLLSSTSSSGVNPYVGFAWWQYGDNAGEQTNWGLVTLLDNAYDGHETVTGSVPCSPPESAYTCGGEAGNYGNVISSVIIANGLWRLIGN